MISYCSEGVSHGNKLPEQLEQTLQRDNYVWPKRLLGSPSTRTPAGSDAYSAPLTSFTAEKSGVEVMDKMGGVVLDMDMNFAGTSPADGGIRFGFRAT